jgi:hypothetical protein
MKKLSTLVAIVVIASWSVVRAQQPQEPSVSSQPTDKISRYLLETYITPHRFIADNPASPVTFKSWLEEKRTSYSAWLARL